MQGHGYETSHRRHNLGYNIVWPCYNCEDSSCSFVSCVHIHSKQLLYIRHNKTFFPIECVVNTYVIYKDSSFVLFVPCIVNNYFTTVGQQNAQCSSWDIYIILQHWSFLHVSVHLGSPSENKYHLYCIKLHLVIFTHN